MFTLQCLKWHTCITLFQQEFMKVGETLNAHFTLEMFFLLSGMSPALMLLKNYLITWRKLTSMMYTDPLPLIYEEKQKEKFFLTESKKNMKEDLPLRNMLLS